jgi:hypothetical protein
MTLQTQNDRQPSGWKSQIYILGAAIGTLFGLISAYLYARAAEEDADRNGGKPAKIPTGQVLGLGLAALGFVRQITELGKPSRKK